MAYNMFSSLKPVKPVPIVPEVSKSSVSGTGVVSSGDVYRPFVGSGDSAIDGINYINSLYTSPVDEERLRRSSVANRRMLAVTDALRHIGNIYNTAQGASPQTFNSPVLEETSRYERGKALRDAANAKYFSYQQAKALQDAAQRRWSQEQAYKYAKDNADLSLRRSYYNDKLSEEKRWHDLVNALNSKKAESSDANAKARLGIMQQTANTIAQRVANAGSGGRRGGGKGMDEYTTSTETTYNYDNLGRKTGSTTTKKRTVNGRQQATTKKKLPGQGNTGKKKLP